MLLPQVFLFIGAIIILNVGADRVLDGLKATCERHVLSPAVVTLLVLGMDLEETGASLAGALAGYPHVAVGNVLGNTILAITITLGLPALVLARRTPPNPISRTQGLVVGVLAITVAVACFVPAGLFVFGFINLGIFGVLVGWSLRRVKVEPPTGENALPETPTAKSLPGATPSASRHDPSQALEAIPSESPLPAPFLPAQAPETASPETASSLRPVAPLVGGILLLLLGGSLLAYSVDQILAIAHVDESFFGFVIVALATNAEELVLVIKALRRDQPEVGLSVQLGKVAWNLAVTFGLCGLVVGQLAPTGIYIPNIVLFLASIAGLVWMTRGPRAPRGVGVLLGTCLVLFLGVNVAGLVGGFYV